MIRDHAGNRLRMATACAIGITIAIAGGAFVLSFAALSDLAVQAGQPRQLAWIWPVIVDGAILQATISVVALASLTGAQAARRFFWSVLAVAASVSVAGNALYAAVSSQRSLAPLIAAAVATVAPVSLLATTHGLTLLIRAPRYVPLIGAASHDSPVTAPAPVTASSTPLSATSDPNNDSVDAPGTSASGSVADEDRATVATTLKDAGWSNRRIAGHIGVHHKTVARMLENASAAASRKDGESASFRIISGGNAERSKGIHEERKPQS